MYPTSKTHMMAASCAIMLLPALCFGKPVTLLENLRPGEPWDRGVMYFAKTVLFQQTDVGGGGTNAPQIAKVTLAYFTTGNCSGNPEGSGFYSTPDGTSFALTLNTTFGLNAISAWDVGSSNLGITDMPSIQSIAVTFKSTNSSIPQSNFSGNSYACISVTCSSPSCLSGLGTQSFTLKTTAAIGDPADGGLLACNSGGLNNFVTPASDTGTQQWSTTLGVTPAISTTDGAFNTAAIVAAFPAQTDIAGKTCNTFMTNGGYTSGWFLPASVQLACMQTNMSAIGGFALASYWSSTENTNNNALAIQFSNGFVSGVTKTFSVRFRCTRALSS